MAAPDFPNNAPFYSSLSDTLLASSSGTVLRHPVYALEFAFKPVRTIELSLPGREEKKLVGIWFIACDILGMTSIRTSRAAPVVWPFQMIRSA